MGMHKRAPPSVTCFCCCCFTSDLQFAAGVYSSADDWGMLQNIMVKVTHLSLLHNPQRLFQLRVLLHPTADVSNFHRVIARVWLGLLPQTSAQRVLTLAMALQHLVM